MPDQRNLMNFEELYIRVQRRIASEWHKRLDTLISGSQSFILQLLAVHGPQKVSAIAERLDITPGAVTSLADKLMTGGYVERKRDTVDRRVVYLEITDQGREMLVRYKAELKRTVEDFFVGLSEEDLNHLIRIYQQVLRNIEHSREENS